MKLHIIKLINIAEIYYVKGTKEEAKVQQKPRNLSAYYTSIS